MRLLYPWDSPGKNTRVDCHTLLQGIFWTQGSNLGLLCLLHWKGLLFHWCHLGSPVQLLSLCQFYDAHQIPILLFTHTGAFGGLSGRTSVTHYNWALHHYLKKTFFPFLEEIGTSFCKIFFLEKRKLIFTHTWKNMLFSSNWAEYFFKVLKEKSKINFSLTVIL